MRKITCAFLAVLLSVAFIGGCDSQDAVGPAAGEAKPVDTEAFKGMLGQQMKNAKMKDKPAKAPEKAEKK